MSLPEFYEITRQDGRRFLYYRCVKCKCFHVINSTSAEAKKIRLAYRLVKKDIEGELILWCGKGEEPKFYSDEGIRIILIPKNKIPKKERDRFKKEIRRMLGKAHTLGYGIYDEERENVSQIIKNKLEIADRSIKDLQEKKKECEKFLEIIDRGLEG